MYDVKTWPEYASMQAEDPQSDGAAVVRLLACHDLRFPKKTARVTVAVGQKKTRNGEPLKVAEVNDVAQGWGFTCVKKRCQLSQRQGAFEHIHLHEGDRCNALTHQDV
jgi:hypothetical protein